MKRKIIVAISLLSFLLILFGCSTKRQIDIPSEILQEYVYELAKGSGYNGTYEEWISSVSGEKGKDGKNIEISTSFTHIIWRYSDETEWKDLVKIDSIKNNDSKSAYELAVEYGFKGTVSEWLESLKGKDGEVFSNIENAEITENGDLKLYLKDKTEVNVGNITGKDGVSIKDVYFDDKNNLKIELSDNTIIDYGVITGCNHIYGLPVVEVEATCTSIGVEYQECIECGDRKYNYLDQLNHNYGEWTKLISNCVEYVEIRTCEECKRTEVNTSDPITQVHTMVDGECKYCGYMEATLGLEYELQEDNTYKLIGLGVSDTQNIIVPDTHKGLPVTAIGSNVFKADILETIVIPYSIRKVDSDAFVNTTSLRQVRFTGTINDWAQIKFENMYSNPISQTGELYILNKQNKWEEVVEVIINDGITSIGDYQFYNMKKIRNIVIPNSVETIGVSVFENCNEIVEMSIPFIGASREETDSTKNRFGYFFGNNTIPNTIISLSITDCETIYTNALYISNGYIDNLTLCGNLKYVEGYSTFSAGFKNLYFDGTIEDWCNIDFYSEFASPMSRASHFYLKNENGVYEEVTEIVVPDTVTVIKQATFFSFENLKSITLSKNLTSIDYYGIRDCSSLENVYFDGTMEDWFNIEFSYTGYPMEDAEHFYLKNENGVYEEVTEIVVPDTVTEIKQYKISGFDNLKSITIPSTIKYIDYYSFDGDENLENVYFDGTLADWCNIEFVDETSNPMHCAEHFFLKDSNGIYNEVIDLIIDNNISKICEYTFYSFENIKNVYINPSLTEILRYVFLDSTEIENVYYNGTLEEWCNVYFHNGYSNPMIYAENLYLKNGNDNYEIITELVIPNTITEIKDFAFYNLKNINEVIFEEPCQVNRIGWSAFNGCEQLEYIDIPQTVTNIDSYAFAYCPLLKDIFIHNSVTTLGSCVFYGQYTDVYTDLTSIPKNWDSWWDKVGEMPDWALAPSDVFPRVEVTYGVKFFKDGDFKFTVKNNIATIVEYCGDNNEITIPQYLSDGKQEYPVKTLKENLFLNNENLNKVIISEGITTIESGVFYKCTNLTEIVIPKTIKNIEERSFYDCENIKNLYYNGNIENWCNIVFEDVSSNPMYFSEYCYMMNELYEYQLLTEIVIPNSINKIGNHQFCGANYIERLVIPSSVTSIGLYAFAYLEELTNIEIPTSVTTISYGAFAYCNGLTYVDVPDTVFNFESPFIYCSGLIDIKLPIKIASKSSPSFTGCTSLKFIELPNGVTSIPSNAFQNCESLEDIIIPSTVKSIGSSAFSACKSLEIIRIPASVTKVGSGAFPIYYCRMILCEANYASFSRGYWDSSYRNEKKIFWGALGEYATTIDGITYKIYSKGSSNGYAQVYYTLDDSEELTIQNEIEVDGFVYPVTSIRAYAFNNNTTLKSINIPSNITTIDEYAFYGCTELENVEISTGLTKIGKCAFYECPNLKVIRLPSSINSIGSDAFDKKYYSKILCEIESKPSGWEGAYNRSNNVIFNAYNESVVEFENILYRIDSENYTASVICNIHNLGVSKIYPEIEYNGSTYIVNKIETNAFYNNIQLNYIDIPNTIEYIDNYAFYGCKNLYKIEIPNSVKYIGSNLFEGCEKLEIIALPFIGDSIENPSYTHLGYLYGGYNYLANDYSVPRSLKQVTITSNINISSYAFYNCRDLLVVILPSGIDNIGAYAFTACSKLSIYCDEVTQPSSWDENWNSSLRPVYWGQEFDGNFGDEEEVELTEFVENGFYYMLDNDDYTATITNYTGSDEDLVIPSTIIVNDIEYKIVIIGAEAFYNKDLIKTVKLPTYLEKIENHAFYSCGSLEKVEFNPHLKSIGTYAFAYCYALENVEIKSELEEILRGGFDECESLVSVDLGNYVTYIGQYAFSDCEKLVKINIGNSVEYIGSSAFYRCHELKMIYIPDTVVTMESSIFYCNKIKIYCAASSNRPGWCEPRYEWGVDTSNAWYSYSPVYWGVSKDQLIELGNYNYLLDFENKTAKIVLYNGDEANIEIPGIVTFNSQEYVVDCITDKVFKNNNILEKIIIPNSVSKIWDSAFYNCTNLQYVKLPESLEIIGMNCFSYCGKLEELTLPNKVTTISDYAFSYCSSLKEFSMSDNVKTIGNYAFINCSNLEKIILSSTLESIGEYCFRNCTNLLDIEIADSLTYLGRYAFYECNKLTNVKLSNSLYEILEYTFYGCHELTMIEISENLEYIEQSSFELCENISIVKYNCADKDYANIYFENLYSNPAWNGSQIYFKDLNENYYEIDEIVIDVTTSDKYLKSYSYAGFENLNKVYISSGYTNIPSYFFYNCINLEEVIFEEEYNNYTICSFAFTGCTNLKGISLPKNTTSIEESAFEDCTNLQVIKLFEKITYIGKNAFNNCTSLSNISLPSKIERIEDGAFANCTNLTNFDLPQKLTYIGTKAFENCISLTEFTIPSSVTEMGGAPFAGCINLCNLKVSSYNEYFMINEYNIYSKDGTVLYQYGSTKTNATYNVPTTVQTIAEYAFEGCRRLYEVRIGTNVEYIREHAFKDCINLTILCRVSSKPYDWDTYWNSSNCPVEYGRYW